MGSGELPLNWAELQLISTSWFSKAKAPPMEVVFCFDVAHFQNLKPANKPQFPRDLVWKPGAAKAAWSVVAPEKQTGELWHALLWAQSGAFSS